MTQDPKKEEAQQWWRRAIDPRTWTEAPEAVPRAGESTMISLRLPTKMLTILKEFARREDIGYQVLLKRWLDDRIRDEAEKLKASTFDVRVSSPIIELTAVAFRQPAVEPANVVEEVDAQP